MKRSKIYIPEEILLDILVRLPVKSLGRFRCVRKSWNHTISTTSFINTHKNTISSTKSPYLLCDHKGFYSLLVNEELTSYRPYYYRPKLFGTNLKFDVGIQLSSRRDLSGIKLNYKIKVYGSCQGLLCVSETPLKVDGIIYLLNPIIRKAKRIPKIPINERGVNVGLCLGYVDDDYKVIAIIHSSSRLCVGVYSLITDCWKIKNCNRNDNDDGGFWLYFTYKVAFVNGVAYFLSFPYYLSYTSRFLCFDMHDEEIRDLKFPENFNHQVDNWYHMSALEVYGESIAFMGVNNGVLAMWVLKNCGRTKTSTWEKKVTIDLGKTAATSYPVGFLNSGTYLLKNIGQSNDFYLCNLENSERSSFRDEENPGHLLRINSFVGSFALLNEKTIDPFVDKELGGSPALPLY